MTKINKIFTKDLLNEIDRRILLHHELYESIKIKSTYWEHILVASFEKTGHKNIEWEAESHSQGVDVKVDGISISCKSGKKVKKNRFTFSSYRTTKYKTLEEKLEFLNDKKEDCFLFLNSEKNHYDIYHLDRDYFNFDENNIKWEKTNSGWKGTGKFDIKIVKAMSDQVWIEMPLSDLTLLKTVKLK